MFPPPPTGRVAAAALDGSAEHSHRQGRLTAAPLSAAFTIARAAEMLGLTADLIDKIADQSEPEDGRLRLYDTDERTTPGFIMRGLERLKELIANQKR